ncbi:MULTISPECIES: isoprenylcysteine carboxylmethyltransferase family protein [unclassified Curtobacterium]|uniref:methyltransferase family protein n=1 Tax=unclassified Curtobacterium TaxID=257496 RepID=UPI00052A599E|nr:MULTISPECIES: isoprenylcysteine carboxylmethyltransferase family protein [unclassified Curtobacterium]AIV40008.1 membrane protein [Curtobacterium sp. MR_MD2014]MCM3505099.1 isoprenylcysteine carboxylmethyltransferase family protein [Curtobacterium sp. ODYSSEY 48 V2]MCM3521276.1 isoprenylcysteine carboxylmethyltransferase family protein [Curtobacterium sp. P97]MDB6425972.1 isoprenylcysteine carboxylmethyltransferase family protein [Curtobacterium sp. 20TX0008]MDT0209232.1 isoprenylcysteine c
MSWGRWWFALQASGGAVWWLLVPTVPIVRTATLGSLDPVPVAALDVPLFVVASALAAAGLRWSAVVATGWTVLVLLGTAAWATVTREAGWGVVAMTAATVGSVLALCHVLLGRVPTELVTSGPLRFRTADPDAGPVRHLLGTAVQIVVFWGLFLGVLPLLIAAAETRWRLRPPLPDAVVQVVSGTGLVVFVLASLLGLASAVSMSTRGGGTPLPSAMPNRLVVAGPYRVVRNPMALAGLTQGAAVGLVAASWTVLVYAVAGSVVWNCVVRPLEERDLEQRFGDDFRRYAAAVRCWVPRLRPVPRS